MVVYVSACVHVLYVQVYVYEHVCMCAYVHEYACRRAYVCISEYLCVCMYT